MSITAKGENKDCNENREVKRNSVQGDFAVVKGSGSMFPMHGAWVPSLIRELDPTC